MPTRVRFDRFYRTRAARDARGVGRGFPGLLVESIGQSYEGREIPIATVTNLETGPPEEKPAVFVHAQIHAMEFTGTTAALNLLDRLLGHGSDERVTQALDTRAFYIVPRVNPDGADAGLADERFRRSSVRPYPHDEPQDGLHREDVDGDGQVLMMQLRDPNGSWKPHTPTTCATAVARQRTTSTASSTALYPEGTIPELGRRDRHDRPRARGPRPEPELARDWAPEGQSSAGRTHVRAECARSSRRSSIGRTSRATSATTFSGVHLRPYSGRSDETSRPPTCERSSSWARRRHGSPAARRSRSSTTSSTTPSSSSRATSTGSTTSSARSRG